MESKNNINHINHNHITATIILTISKGNKNKSPSNDIGFVNYYEQQRSKYVLLMALNVRWTAVKTNMNLRRGG